MVSKDLSSSDKAPYDLVHNLGRKAKDASNILLNTPEDTINRALIDCADGLRRKTSALIDKNALDIKRAKEKKLTKAQIDRLTLNKDRIEAMASSLEAIAELNDPLKGVLESWVRPNGLQIDKIAVPLGVLGLIYESRPNVTIDAAALALKSHNAIVLRGGSEALGTSLALHDVLMEALRDNDLPEEAVSIIRVPDRAIVSELLHANKYIDVMIPRGGANLIERVMREAKMPVFAHLDGICHIYVDRDADPQKAKDVVINAKMRRTGICGAAETLLIDESYDDIDAKELIQALMDSGCKVVGDNTAQSLVSSVLPAKEKDWETEYLDAKISVKFVKDLKQAIMHINNYGSHHTDSILTENTETAEQFFRYIDSGIVLQNASTQFADGGEFGMGAEIGISTGKLHARGPVGLEQLTTYKYLVRGNGQTRP